MRPPILPFLNTMPKFNETLTNEPYFEVDDLAYQKGSYYPEYNANDGTFGIKYQGNPKELPQYLIKPVSFEQWTNSSDTPYASFDDLLTDVKAAFFFKLNGGGGGTILKTGFIDYNDTTGDINLLADQWTDVPNNGAGPFSNDSYKPDNINEVLDTATGYLDFSELSLGSQIIVRNDFQVTPSTNNSLLQLRYVLGQGVGEYNLLFWSERLDSGSGIAYQRVVSFPIYMGDLNTQGGPGKLQVKLSTTGVFNNSGSYINISVR